MRVPFLDLKVQYESIKAEVNEAIQSVLDKCAFAGGPFVEAFENNFVEFCQSKHAVGVGNGTEALWLALLAMGIGPGDEVITTPLTFCATVNAIIHTGATPVLADVDPKTMNLDPVQVANRITPRTRAIIPVHFAGRPCDMDALLGLASEDEVEAMPANSTLARDIERFRFFSQGYLYRYPERPEVIGDLRYAMFPDSVKPLWGITFDPERPDDHAELVYFREASKGSLGRLLAMIRSRDLPVGE